MTPTCLIMAQVGIRTKAYKNDCNGWEPNVTTAKSAAAAPRRARRRAGSLQQSLQRQKTIATEPHHVRTAKSAAAAQRRARRSRRRAGSLQRSIANEPAPGSLPTSKRADVDGLQPSPEASEVTGAVTCLKEQIQRYPAK